MISYLNKVNVETIKYRARRARKSQRKMKIRSRLFQIMSGKKYKEEIARNEAKAMGK